MKKNVLELLLLMDKSGEEINWQNGMQLLSVIYRSVIDITQLEQTIRENPTFAKTLSLIMTLQDNHRYTTNPKKHCTSAVAFLLQTLLNILELRVCYYKTILLDDDYHEQSDTRNDLPQHTCRTVMILLTLGVRVAAEI